MTKSRHAAWLRTRSNARSKRTALSAIIVNLESFGPRRHDGTVQSIEHVFEKTLVDGAELAIVAELNLAIAEDSQDKLSHFWSGILAATGLAANAVTTAQFAIDNKVSTLAALLTVSAKISS